MRPLDIFDVLSGKVRGNFSIEDKFGNILERSVDSYSAIIKHKGKVIYSGGYCNDYSKNKWHWENLPEELSVATKDFGIIEYLSRLEDNHFMLFKNGSVKKKWFLDLAARLEVDPVSFETSKRMNIFLSRLEELKSRIGFSDLEDAPKYLKPILRNLVIDAVTGELKYSESVFDPIKKYYGYYVTDNKVVLGHFYSSPNHVRLHLNVWFCYDYDSIWDWTNVEEENIPTIFVSTLLQNGVASICTSCGKVVLTEKLVCGECPTCCRLSSEELELKSYSTKATDTFDFKIHKKSNRTKDNAKFFGVELEYECDNKVKDGAAYSLKNLKSHAILKRDGSVGGGLEIVTAPADIQTHKEEFESFFKGINDSVLKSKSNTGMHIHVDRGTALTDFDGKIHSYTKMSYLTIGKILNFMQSERNKGFVKFIGERESSYAKLGTNDNISSSFVSMNHERYKALNLCNKETIEFRIFATPVKYENFCKNLEFVDAITDFCSAGGSGIGQMKVKDFISYVDQRRAAYPNLVKFMKGYKE